MLLSLVLACLCAPNGMTEIRLTPDQMFHLQFPYRYHVRIVDTVWHPVLNRYEIEIEDLYVEDVEILEIEAPSGDRRFPRGTVTALRLKLKDVLSFPNDRYSCTDSQHLEYESPILLTITDRREKKTIWPPPPPPDY